MACWPSLAANVTGISQKPNFKLIKQLMHLQSEVQQSFLFFLISQAPWIDQKSMFLSFNLTANSQSSDVYSTCTTAYWLWKNFISFVRQQT